LYREKYELAVAYIKKMHNSNKSEEKKNASLEAIDDNINLFCENFLPKHRESLSFYQAIDSPLANIFCDDITINQNSTETKVNEFNITEDEIGDGASAGDKATNLLTKIAPYDKEENNRLNKLNINSQNPSVHPENGQISNQEQLITKAYKARKMQMLEKLKDEYHNLVEDKKNLENKITEFKGKEKEFDEIGKRNENLSLQLEIANEKIQCFMEEKKAMLERNNKITFENYEISNTNNQLKESLKYLEKERLLNKNKINSNFNKVKLYEKENNASKKNLNKLNINIKNLTEKLNSSLQEKLILEKRMEDLKQEYENKITNLMLEQQKIIKDSFLTTLSNLEEKKIPLEFFYEEEKNSLTIMLEDIIISEFTNLRIFKKDKSGKVEDFKGIEELSPKKEIKNDPEQLNSSISSNIRVEKIDNVNSPSNRSSIMNINNRNIFNNNNMSGSSHKNTKIDLENLLSLNKILSGSSKKSFTNTNTKRILMSNFSSAKKISAFHEENNNNNVCTAFSSAPFDTFNNQIYQFALNKAHNLNGNNNIQSFSNYMTNNINKITSTNSNMKVIPEEIYQKVQVSSSKDGINLYNASLDQNSNYSKVSNITNNINYKEHNTSHYENDRYSGVNFSAKNKRKVSNLMSGKKENNSNNNNNFYFNEKDENRNPNIQSHLQYENSIIRKSNSKMDVNCSLISNFNNTIIEERANMNENTNNLPSERSKKLNGRGNNLSLVGVKAFNNNNFEKCIKNININSEQINYINKDDIKKIINTASSTRHRKMISLDEALNLEEICDKENLYNESGLNCRSYNSNKIIQPHINLNNGFNYFSTQRNSETTNSHFNFNSKIIESFLNNTLSLEKNLNLQEEEPKQTTDKELSEEPKKDLVSKKIEFDTEETFERILRRRKESNKIENVVTDLVIIAAVKLEEKPIEIIPSYTLSNCGFMIDSNVNLITLNSLNKSDKIMITSENSMNIISKKNKKFNSEKLQLSQNERIDITQAAERIKKDDVIKKIKETKQPFLMITEEKFTLNHEERESIFNISQHKDETCSNKQSSAYKNLDTINGYYIFYIFSIQSTQTS